MNDKAKVSERPILQFSVLCDGVATPKETGNKPVFIGIFNALGGPRTIPQFFIINRWINGTGEHTQKIEILDPELKPILEPSEQKFLLPSKVEAADIFHGFINLNFSKSGVYWVKILLDGELAMSYPFPVFDNK